MSLERFGRRYGGAVLLGDHGDDYFRLTAVQKAKRQGWSNGCPVVPRLIRERGAAKLVNRYGEVNFWSGEIVERLRATGLDRLVSELQGPLQRLPGEKLGKHDKRWIPRELHDTMYGPGTPAGYALPRLLIVFLGDRADPTDMKKVGARSDRAMMALDLLDYAMAVSKEKDYNLNELLCTFTELLVLEAEKSFGQNPGEYFHQLIGTGKLSEDNCRTHYNDLCDTMFALTPRLWNRYNSLSNSDIEEHHVAVPGRDF